MTRPATIAATSIPANAMVRGFPGHGPGAGARRRSGLGERSTRFDRRDQAVTALADRLDDSRRLRPFVEQAAQFPDCPVQHVVGDEDPRPDARHQFLARDDLARALDEGDEHLHDLGLDLHGLAAGGHAVQRRIDQALLQPEHSSSIAAADSAHS